MLSPPFLPEDLLKGGINGITSANGCEGNRNAGACPDNKSRGHDVITDAGFVIGLMKRLSGSCVKVHGDVGFGV